MSPDDQIKETVSFLKARGFDERYDAAMVLGTGLGRLADELGEPRRLPYTEVPHFPPVGVSGHGGELIAGKLAGKRVLIFAGRAHAYESGHAGIMRVPIGIVAELGRPPLILTNAAGSLKLDLRPGSHVILTDHINFSGQNPLTGDKTEGRFVSLVNAYDERLRKKMKLAARAAGVTVNEGVYMWFSGPSFETPSEIKMARVLGADLVGMSTVPEVILARYYGLRVVALSVVTNLASGIGMATISHSDTKSVAAGAAAGLRRLLQAFVSSIDDV